MLLSYDYSLVAAENVETYSIKHTVYKCIKTAVYTH